MRESKVLKVKKALTGIVLLCCAAPFLMSQARTTVTATITDQSGIPYANCTWTATLLDGPLQSGQTSTFVNDGTPVTPRSYAGACNASGTLSFPLWSNTGIYPSGSKWKVAYCDSTGVYCSNASASVTGTTQDLSALLSGVAKPLSAANYVMFPGVPTGACGDTQQAKNQATGDLYTCLNGSWHLAASGATGSVSSCSTDGALGYYASSGTTISCPTTPATVDTNGNVTATSFTGTGPSYITLANNTTTPYVLGMIKNDGGVLTWGTGTATSVPLMEGSVNSAKLLGSSAAGQPVAAGLTSAHIYVGNGSNLPADVAVTGDTTISNAGVTTTATVNGNKVWQDIYDTSSGNVHASIGTTNMVSSVPASALYSFTFDISQVDVGASCAGNSTVAVALQFTDADSASGSGTAVNQTLGLVPWASTDSGVASLTLAQTTITSTNLGRASRPSPFYAKVGTAISYTTTYTPNGSCSPGPNYIIRPVLSVLK